VGDPITIQRALASEAAAYEALLAQLHVSRAFTPALTPADIFA
jgi:hypothetical protein